MTLNNRIPPPIVGLGTALLMWLVARQWPGEWFSQTPTRWLCGGLITLSLLLDGWAILAFRRTRTTVNPLAPEKASAIVQAGPYRVTRNPMYLGMAIILLACVIGFGQPLNLVLLGLFIAYLTAFQIKPEERALEARFGDEYRRYRARVRRWL
ncbi:MAG: isoprenylcysteine carboxylmethyltransferase family protein [Pseudomonadota bacterium]